MAATTADFSPTDAVRGIDVSHFQGQIDWPKVAGGGISFCYVKATDGVAFSDVRFVANYGGSKGAGLLTGAYHFLRPELNAEQQAESFLHLLPQLSIGELPPVLDVELAGGANASTIIDAVQTWVEAVENVLLRRPIIYTLASFWNSALGATRQFDDYFFWIADYGARLTPRLPIGRADYEFWQFSETGSVPGIAGKVDLNRFIGSAEDLRALADG